MSPYHDNISGNKEEVLNQFFLKVCVFLSYQVLTLVQEIKLNSQSIELRNQYYDKLVSDLPFLFTKEKLEMSDYENVKSLMRYKQRVYFKEAFLNLTDSPYKNTALGLYECFNMYSKYFHFGFYTMAFQESNNDLIKVMIHALAFSVSSCTLLAVANKGKVDHDGGNLESMQLLSKEIKEIANNIP